MTDQQRRMIEAYLPHDPDPTLEDDEFFYLQSTTRGERVIRVFALNVLCMGDGSTEYGLYQQRGAGLHWVDGYGAGDRNRGARRAALYDNAQDCRDQTHQMYDNWEALRRLQRKEAGI